HRHGAGARGRRGRRDRRTGRSRAARPGLSVPAPDRAPPARRPGPAGPPPARGARRARPARAPRGVPRRWHPARARRALAARHPRGVPPAARLTPARTASFAVVSGARRACSRSASARPIGRVVALVIAALHWYEAAMGIQKLDTIWVDGALIPWDEASEH